MTVVAEQDNRVPHPSTQRCGQLRLLLCTHACPWPQPSLSHNILYGVLTETGTRNFRRCGVNFYEGKDDQEALGGGDEPMG